VACELSISAADPDVYNNVIDVFSASIANRYAEDGLDAIGRTFIGMGPIPAEDCCPDLVYWVSNVRPYDATPPDGLRENALGVHWGIAFDVNVRVGQCYLEGDDKGAFPAATITGYSEILNRYGHSTYMGALTAMDDFGTCDVLLTPQAMYPFQSGGCAGWQFAITVAVL
jgi:hypothetical protein